MEATKRFGVCLFQKETHSLQVLRDLMQLMKRTRGPKCGQFFYVDQNSLLPHLSLEENIRLTSRVDSWKELGIQLGQSPAKALYNLIKNPGRAARETECWEQFIVSLLQGVVGPHENLLIHASEEILNPFMVKTLKEVLVSQAAIQQIYLATHNTSLWLDCAHSLVNRKGYEFQTQNLDETLVRKHWSVA